MSGKAQNKAKLQERVGLPVRADVPLVGIVSRLTRQKGFDVVVESLHHILQEDVQIVLLGTGDPAFEETFSWFAQIYPDKLSANITFDVKLAQEIYAACDLFLMPSRFEPCGLSQMMAMRYGPCHWFMKLVACEIPFALSIQSKEAVLVLALTIYLLIG